MQNLVSSLAAFSSHLWPLVLRLIECLLGQKDHRLTCYTFVNQYAISYLSRRNRSLPPPSTRGILNGPLRSRAFVHVPCPESARCSSLDWWNTATESYGLPCRHHIKPLQPREEGGGERIPRTKTRAKLHMKVHRESQRRSRNHQKGWPHQRTTDLRLRHLSCPRAACPLSEALCPNIQDSKHPPQSH